MSATTREHEGEVRRSLARLQTLRDEIRLKLHLAGMDAKDEWRKMEVELDELEQGASRGMADLQAGANAAIKKLEPFLTELGHAGI